MLVNKYTKTAWKGSYFLNTPVYTYKYGSYDISDFVKFLLKNDLDFDDENPSGEVFALIKHMIDLESNNPSVIITMSSYFFAVKDRHTRNTYNPTGNASYLDISTQQIVWSNEKGLPHRLDGPARTGIIYNDSYINKWYVNGKDITLAIRDWAIESNIDLENLSEDDKIMLKFRWAGEE